MFERYQMKRYKMKKQKSRRKFRKTTGVHKRNTARPAMRTGTRL